MKLLHTADWHLGQKFLYNDRAREHEQALNWILNQIEKEEVDVLIIAGDVFDVANPPNFARKQYYRFLGRLIHTSCRHVVIVGGNHDSPSMLEATEDLLAIMSESEMDITIHVRGAFTGNYEDELIPLYNKEKKLEAVIAAVPFLRDQDIRGSVAGQSFEDRQQSIRDGITNHYLKMAELVAPFQKDKVPLIATGHLFATGGTRAAGRLNRIHIGLFDTIEAEQFPAIFDYVALGHLHRPQMLDSQLPHIRYSGSIIPLDFSEIKDQKVVNLVHFENGKIKGEIELLPIPVFRKLIRLEGDLESVQKKLEAIPAEEKEDYAWVDVLVKTEQIIPDLDRQLRSFSKELPLELLKIRTQGNYKALDEQILEVDLDDLSVEEVFKRKCESLGEAPKEMKDLQKTFKELLSWIDEKEEEGQ